MRLFHCPCCDTPVGFDAMRCVACDANLGYLPPLADVVEVDPATGSTVSLVDPVPPSWWRCLNAAFGCSWLVKRDAGTPWCASCRLTRGRPHHDDVAAVAAWAATEADKRHLLHELTELGLPVEGRSEAHPHGLVFELVHVPGLPAVTGHLDGVVTIDLTEADDVHREALRHQLGEGTRSMLGHLRHEMGHYFWPRLVDEDLVHEFRALFGDERTDYRSALDTHHRVLHPSLDWDRTRYISAYATSHPMEDWAETFAHHMLISDATETARTLGLGVPTGASRDRSGAGLAAEWAALAKALDAVARSLGSRPMYPFDLTPCVVEKLSFVDRCIRRARGSSPDGDGGLRPYRPVASASTADPVDRR